VALVRHELDEPKGVVNTGSPYCIGGSGGAWVLVSGLDGSVIFVHLVASGQILPFCEASHVQAQLLVF
jgi:hypothetical protein